MKSPNKITKSKITTALLLYCLVTATHDTLPLVCRHPPQSYKCVFLRTPRLNEWSPHPSLDTIYSPNLLYSSNKKISCCSVIMCDYRHCCHRWHFASVALALTAPCTGIWSWRNCGGTLKTTQHSINWYGWIWF